MWSREISWCVCGNPKAFTHLFILFLLPLHPRIIAFPTVYRNRHNHCTFLPSEKRQPPLRLQFYSVTGKQNTCNPPSITFIPLLMQIHLEPYCLKFWDLSENSSQLQKQPFLAGPNYQSSFSFQSHFTSGSLLPHCCRWPLYNKPHTSVFEHVWSELFYTVCCHSI